MFWFLLFAGRFLSINFTVNILFSQWMGFYDAALFLCSRDIIGFYCFKYHFFRRHWSLLIFCHFGESTKSETRTPCMLLLDSLEKANPRQLEPDIRKYVYQNLPPCVGIIVYSMFLFLIFIFFFP